MMWKVVKLLPALYSHCKTQLAKEIMKDLTTDDHGVLVIPDLAPGDYQFIETKAPEHYKLDKTPIKFTIKKGSKEDLPIPVTVKIVYLQVASL